MNTSSFISVDWGTTNLRIRWVQLPDFSVSQSRNSELGVKQVFSLWQQSGRDRKEFFLEVLLGEIRAMKIDPPDSCQVIISGMASSSIGMLELPYAPLPFFADGKALKVEKWTPEGFPYPVSLISGVQSSDDVMRGEETQLIGLYQLLNPADRSLFILPGTHSKHIFLEQDRIVSFKTYMTGELFDLLSRHSILSSTVEQGPRDQSTKVAFEKGILLAQEKESVLNALFTVRTNSLFRKFSPKDNFYFLSGLLIGAECKYLKTENGQRIYICSSGILFSLYLEATKILGISVALHLFSDEMVDMALRKGQWLIHQSKEA